MKWLSELGRALDNGWFSRLLVLGQFYFVYWSLDWSMSFASTALAGSIQGKLDLLGGAAANIGAVFLGPQALLMLATSKYQEMRATRPVVVTDRRKEP